MVGCGNSFMVADLARQGFRHVVGMDYSKRLGYKKASRNRWVHRREECMPGLESLSRPEIGMSKDQSQGVRLWKDRPN